MGQAEELLLQSAARAQARAEYALWSMVLTAHEAGTRAVDAEDAPEIGKELGRRGVTLEIARALHVTENRVWGIVRDAGTLRERAPRVWIAFGDGSLDAARAGLIASTVQQLRTTEATEQLDASVVAYARTHTPGELRAWLRRMRARLEPEQATEEAKRAVESRRVEISHNPDGTSWLSALLPTPVAVAVGNRLRKAVKALPTIDPETDRRDRRTRDQKRADLLAHWLTCSEGTHTDIRAEIAISIDAADLIGLTDGPASRSTASTPCRPTGSASSLPARPRCSAGWSSIRRGASWTRPVSATNRPAHSDPHSSGETAPAGSPGARPRRARPTRTIDSPTTQAARPPAKTSDACVASTTT